MKKFLLTLAFCMTFGSMLMAQDDYTETRVYNKFVSKTINKDNTHKWNLNFLALETASPKTRSGWSHYTCFGPDQIYVGFAEMADTKDFNIKPGSSWEWGFSLASFEVANRSRHFGISTSIMLSRSSYRIKGDDAFHVVNLNGEKWTVCDDAPLFDKKGEPIDYSRQRLIHWSWRVPVMLNFRTDNGLRFSVGAEGELRHHVRSRAKVGKEKKYYLERNNLDVNPFGYNALVEFGNDDFSIVGRYGLSEMFGNKSKVDCQPFMLGISFHLE